MSCQGICLYRHAADFYTVSIYCICLTHNVLQNTADFIGWYDFPAVFRRPECLDCGNGENLFHVIAKSFVIPFTEFIECYTHDS